MVSCKVFQSNKICILFDIEIQIEKSSLIHFTAHGPVSKSYVEITENGMTLHWDPPINRNGKIDGYAITWVYNNETFERNVTENSFKFPNTTNLDRFNITIRAYGVAGYGNPLIINPDKWNKLPIKGKDLKSNNSLYVILVILIASIGLLLLAMGYVLCRRHRYCKQHGMLSSEQSSFQTPSTAPLGANIRMDEMYEMQTLISTSQALMSNGKDVNTTASSINKIENRSNGGINITENQKALRTSTPTDDSIDQICLESPPIKRDEISNPQKTSSTSDNGDGLSELKLNFLPPPSQPNNTMTKAIDIITKKDTRNGTVKVNGGDGNLSPYKSLQVRFKMIDNSI